MDRLFRVACKAEQEIKRRVALKENKHKVHIPRDGTVVLSTTRRAMTTTSVVVRTTSPPPCDTAPPTVPTSELIVRGNDKGTDLPLHMSMMNALSISMNHTMSYPLL